MFNKKNILWDQDHTVLEGNLDNPNNFKTNKSLRKELKKDNNIGYNHFIFSNKSKDASIRKSKISNMHDLFTEYFDSRKITGSKSIESFSKWSSLGLNKLIENTIYIGDNIDGEIIYDVPNLVQIFNRNAINHDVKIYFEIMKYLEKLSNNNYSKAFDLAYKSNSLNKVNQKGIEFLLQPIKINNLFNSRSNYQDYQKVNLTGYANIILISKVNKKYLLN